MLPQREQLTAQNHSRRKRSSEQHLQRAALTVLAQTPAGFQRHNYLEDGVKAEGHQKAEGDSLIASSWSDLHPDPNEAEPEDSKQRHRGPNQQAGQTVADRQPVEWIQLQFRATAL